LGHRLERVLADELWQPHAKALGSGGGIALG
jgi:hypothetical protein